MWDIDSYRDVLSEHASRGHAIASGLIVVIVAAALLIVFA
jgi:hypothetical protein